MLDGLYGQFVQMNEKKGKEGKKMAIYIRIKS